jgi:hypothetical protein
MQPEEIDRILAQAAGRSVPHSLNPAVIERAKAVLPERLAPVRPLAPAWMFTSVLFAAFAAVSVICALLLGLRGLHALNGIQLTVIFPVLVAGAGIAAVASAREMRPAGGKRIGRFALAVSTLALLGAFALLLRDYDTQKFVSEGVPCLVAGLACAIPAAIVIWLFLRRGFVLDLPAAGLAAGTLAGLAGIAMLEMHCAILKAPHVMFWHVAVVPVCGVGGLLIGAVAQALVARDSSRSGEL